VIRVKHTLFMLLTAFFLVACSGLPPLTQDVLLQAEQKWKAHEPAQYRMVIEMSGDRVETGTFEVEVHGGKVSSLRRNGREIQANPGQDYSMDGLFHMLEQELGLAEKPSMLGAPEGYAVYTSAKFDDATGRLIHYRRTVGGTPNSIEVNIRDYQELSK
jgi:Family of unknown function (DUF6174)